MKRETISVTQLRRHIGRFIEQASKGKIFTITRRRAVVAFLMPTGFLSEFCGKEACRSLQSAQPTLVNQKEWEQGLMKFAKRVGLPDAKAKAFVQEVISRRGEWLK